MLWNRREKATFNTQTQSNRIWRGTATPLTKPQSNVWKRPRSSLIKKTGSVKIHTGPPDTHKGDREESKPEQIERQVRPVKQLQRRRTLKTTESSISTRPWSRKWKPETETPTTREENHKTALKTLKTPSFGLKREDKPPRASSAYREIHRSAPDQTKKKQEKHQGFSVVSLPWIWTTIKGSRRSRGSSNTTCRS